MTIEVVSPGMFTTVQDLGRPGYGMLGVSRCGAADPIALRIGNKLVGNPENRAALEMTLLGGTFRFTANATVALTGSECDVPTWRTLTIAAGEELKVGRMQSGARSYLCVQGGISVPLFAESASTHVLSGLGGFDGRALQKGDVLSIGKPTASAVDRFVSPENLALLAPRKSIRVTAGPQAKLFADASIRAFYRAAFQVTNDSNRLGLRLNGAHIEAPFSGQMVTEGVSLGAIQIPASGQPIILFVDQQTTGGYPKLANVITADLPSVVQLRPRDEIQFELVVPQFAQYLLLQQESLLRSACDN